jgi:solute:Na+ symporter, SSS family
VSWILWLVLAYLLVLGGFNFWRARKVKSQEDFMVAGRSLPLSVMVFTLICTWIGSGTFIAGAEYAVHAGWSSLWMPAGAWLGITVIFFFAARIRTFGQYTIGDILEERYGRFARAFGAIALIVAFTTIVSYQFRAGGYILNVVTGGQISVEAGQAITAGFVILFTALGGMVAVAHTDLPNGIIIVTACLGAMPLVIGLGGGIDGPAAVLPASHFQAFAADFGQYPALKAGGYFLATMMLLMGVQSMYQKFYSARSPRDARTAVAIWIFGTIIVETLVIIIAVYGAARHWADISSGKIDPASIVLVAAQDIVARGGLGIVFGVLLLAAACAVVISTGMNYLLSPTTNIMRDIYQRFINPNAAPARMVALQKLFVLVIGLCAFLMVFIPTALHLKISVLKYSYFAYTMYGVAITPALLAALVWRRATRAGGVASIVGGAIMAVLFELVLPYGFPGVMVGPAGSQDPWGVPSIYPALAVSVALLVVVSLVTPRPAPESLAKLFPARE